VSTRTPPAPRSQPAPVSPIRAARAATLAWWLARTGRIRLDKDLYDKLRSAEGWTRAQLDSAVDHLVQAGGARLVHRDFILFLEVAEGEP